jgi:hypothetical protein
MMTRRKIITILTAIFFVTLAVVWSIDSIRAQDTTTTTTTTTGDVSQGASMITNIGGTTTYDAGSENIFNVENTTSQTDITKIVKSGHSVIPSVYLGGYPYGAGSGYNSLAHEDIIKNNQMLVEIINRLDRIDARLARIEKALNIKPFEPAKSGSVPHEKRALSYSTD